MNENTYEIDLDERGFAHIELIIQQIMAGNQRME